MTRHLLEIDDLSCAELNDVLSLAAAPAETAAPVLAGRGAALVFEKPSLRTRSATELAVVSLGGHPLYIQGVEVGIDTREPAEDVARTLAAYHSVICARVLDHEVLVRMAGVLDSHRGPGAAGVAVVNLLSDRSHPGQAVADLLTLRQAFGDLAGRTLAYIGDPNNVWRSLVLGAAMMGMTVRTASPEGYEPDPDDIARITRLGGVIEVTTDPAEAVAGADAVYTDVWTSMGHEDEAELRRKAFFGFTVDDELLAGASPDVVVLHCLPAHRGEEISSSVIDGPRSRVWPQATNRMHAMRGLLGWLLGPGANT
jgi:ornithine carbamoyltransferase